MISYITSYENVCMYVIVYLLFRSRLGRIARRFLIIIIIIVIALLLLLFRKL